MAEEANARFPALEEQPAAYIWFGLTDLTFGYDPAGVEVTESVKNVLDDFTDRVSRGKRQARRIIWL